MLSRRDTALACGVALAAACSFAVGLAVARKRRRAASGDDVAALGSATAGGADATCRRAASGDDVAALGSATAGRADAAASAASTGLAPTAGAGDGWANRVVLITGASSGIGRALALRLAASGAQLAIHYASARARAEEVVAAALAAGAPRAHAFAADFAGGDAAAPAALIAAVLAHFGRVDVLVNNAGEYAESAVAACAPDAGAFAALWRRTMAINVDAPALLTLLAAQHMMARDPQPAPPTARGAAAIGAILFVGSRGAFRGEPRAWAYGASKAALHQLAQSAAVALGGAGIVCAAVAPGFIETPMAAAALAGAAGAAIRGQSAWGRVGTPEEVADALAFAGRFWANAWIAGTIIDVNGASYLRS